MNNYFLKVKEVINETHDTITIRFHQPENKITYKAGQFLTFILSINGETVRRSYSLCSSPLVDTDLAVTVKRVTQGKVSNYLNDTVKAGTVIECLPPVGVFTLEVNSTQERNIVLFAGGSGITPLMSILKTVLVGEPKSFVTLVYANNKAENIIFKKELDQLHETHQGRLKIFHVLTFLPSDWHAYQGRLNPDLIKQVYHQLPIKPLQEYFLCGPTGMMDEIKHTLEALQISEAYIKQEKFVSSPEELTLEPNTHLSEQEVTILYEGDTHKFKVAPNQSILEAALALNIQLPYSCQSGLCTACMGKCTSGKVYLAESDILSNKEIAEGFVLTCVGHPLTPNVTIKID